jgi:hypothetical protein
MTQRDKRALTLGFRGQLSTLLRSRDPFLVLILAVVFTSLLPFLSASIDVTGPLLGVAGTLVALSIPAAGLAGPAAEQDRQFWEQVWNVRSSEFTKEQIDTQLEAMVARLKGLWRGLMWIYLSLPFAAFAALRPNVAGLISAPDLTIDLSQPPLLHSSQVTIELWQVSAAVAIALIVTAVVRLVPPTWQLLHIQSIEAVRSAVWNAKSKPQEQKPG